MKLTLRKVIRKRFVAAVMAFVFVASLLAFTSRSWEYWTPRRPSRATPGVHDVCGMMCRDRTLQFYHLLYPNHPRPAFADISPPGIEELEFSERFVTAVDDGKKVPCAYKNLGEYGWIILCQLWLVQTALATTLVISLAVAWRSRPRWPAGSCQRCGYDRTGLPQTARCPECGTHPAS